MILVAATLVAYQPVWNAGFIWDDDDYVTQNPTLHDLNGLRRIWFEVGAVPQYYPMVHTVFWVEQHVWGYWAPGYHMVNLLLHALAAILLARVLLHLKLPGAWLAAFIFALHPVGVESAAWITELKNVLSTVFYLAAALTYWRFEAGRDAGRVGAPVWRAYAGAFALFLAALLSKTVTTSLPAALLLIRWWRRGELRSSDVAPLLPFFAVGMALSAQTAWIEQQLGAHGTQWSLTFAERCLVAGRALWFYAAKLLWPANLAFIYPRWTIDAAAWWQWLFPIAAVGLVLALWLARNRIGRGPITAVLLFAGTLTPALGFVNVYPMRYSFVADHFQYLASIALIALAAAAASERLGQWERSETRRAAIYAVPLFILALLTWRQAHIYEDLETLWRATIARNPECSMAHNNLGNILLRRNDIGEAMVHLRQAVDLQPDNPEARDSLGTALLEHGEVDEAMQHYRASVDLDPTRAEAHYNLGTAFLQKKQMDEAMAEFERALALKNEAMTHNNIAFILVGRDQIDAAEEHYREAVRIRPDLAEGRVGLGLVLFRRGKIDDAIAAFEAAIRIRPDLVQAYDNLRIVAWTLATHPEASIRNGARAVQLGEELNRVTGGANSGVARTLAAAYAESGRFADAVAAAERAIQLATAEGNDALVGAIQIELSLYRAQRPFRDVGSST